MQRIYDKQRQPELDITHNTTALNNITSTEVHKVNMYDATVSEYRPVD
jgi:hypothetical protein